MYQKKDENTDTLKTIIYNTMPEITGIDPPDLVSNAIAGECIREYQ